MTILIVKVDKVDTSCRWAVNLTQIYIKFQGTSKVIGLVGPVGHWITATLMDKGMVVQSQSKFIAAGLDVCCFETVHIELFIY